MDSSIQPFIAKHLRFNFAMNILDGAFFGLAAVGLASLVTVIPLFLNKLGASEVLIGVVASLHVIGWQLPQLFMASRVSKLTRYKPMILWMTVHERWPMFGLAVCAALTLVWPSEWVLALTFIFLVIYALGGGFAAPAWQSMIGKVMPKTMHSTFFGSQSAAANLLGAGGAVLAGYLLSALPYPHNFIACFSLAGISMMISMGFLALTKEPTHENTTQDHHMGWKPMLRILQYDRNFQWFLLARMLTAFATVAVSFYTLYLVRTFHISEAMAGTLTAVLTISTTIANPIIGYLADRYSRRILYGLGGLLMAASASLALFSTQAETFYAVYALAGIASASFWAVVNAAILEFGTEQEKPLYIGLGNTIVGPVSLGAPIIGGLAANRLGFDAVFLLSIIAGILTWAVLQFLVRRPKPMPMILENEAELSTT